MQRPELDRRQAEDVAELGEGSEPPPAPAAMGTRLASSLTFTRRASSSVRSGSSRRFTSQTKARTAFRVGFQPSVRLSGSMPVNRCESG